MPLHYIHDSIPGTKKEDNEDNVLIVSHLEYTLFFTFDGVGSAQNGCEATKLAAEYILSTYSHYKASNGYRLQDLMYSTNEFLLIQELPELLTTYCAAYIANNNSKEVLYSSLGDSRIYIIGSRYINQITVDDKLQSSKNTITKCLGIPLDKTDFVSTIYPIENELLLFCTDGFYTLMENNLISFFSIFHLPTMDQIKKNLRFHIETKNQDDATFILVNQHV